jgi:hypothetical protein
MGQLIPLLARLDEPVFWLELWHNGLDPEMDMGMGGDFADFVKTEAMELGYTVNEVRAWQQPAPEKGRRGMKP